MDKARSLRQRMNLIKWGRRVASRTWNSDWASIFRSLRKKGTRDMEITYGTKVRHLKPSGGCYLENYTVLQADAGTDVHGRQMCQITPTGQGGAQKYIACLQDLVVQTEGDPATDPDFEVKPMRGDSAVARIDRLYESRCNQLDARCDAVEADREMLHELLERVRAVERSSGPGAEGRFSEVERACKLTDQGLGNLERAYEAHLDGHVDHQPPDAELERQVKDWGVIFNTIVTRISALEQVSLRLLNHVHPDFPTGHLIEEDGEHEWHRLETFKDVKAGALIRNRGSEDVVYLVTNNFGDRLTAVTTADATNPSEWMEFHCAAGESEDGGPWYMGCDDCGHTYTGAEDSVCPECTSTNTQPADPDRDDQGD